MINKDYWSQIKAARETVDLIKLVDEDDVVLIEPEADMPEDEANELAQYYLDQLLMEEGVDTEEPVYAREPIDPNRHRALLHGTADIIITLPECDGMTEEFLFNQPSHGEYLEELTEEVHNE